MPSWRVEIITEIGDRFVHGNITADTAADAASVFINHVSRHTDDLVGPGDVRDLYVARIHREAKEDTRP